MNRWIRRVDSHIDVEVLEESALAMAQATIQNAIDEIGISRAELARKMNCQRSFVTKMLSGSHNLTVTTLARALAACGSEVRFERVPTVWNWGTRDAENFEEALPAQAGSAMPTADLAVGIAVSA